MVTAPHKAMPNCMRLSLDLARVRALAVTVLAGGTLLLAPCVSAEPPWLGDFNSEYGTGGTRLDTCGLCHLNFGTGSRNPYGSAFDNAGGPDNPAAAFAAIEGAFSDSDLTSNLDEITALRRAQASQLNLNAQLALEGLAAHWWRAARSLPPGGRAAET